MEKCAYGEFLIVMLLIGLMSRKLSPQCAIGLMDRYNFFAFPSEEMKILWELISCEFVYLIQVGIIGSMTGNCRFYNVSGIFFITNIYSYFPLSAYAALVLHIGCVSDMTCNI